MTEIVTVEATIAALRAKLRAASPDSKEYYRLCIAGWERWLNRLKDDADDHDRDADPREYGV